jgi:hypothetical protein
MAAANEGKILVVVDVAELAHKPMSTRSPAGDHPVTATLKIRVEALQAELAKVEASAAGQPGPTSSANRSGPDRLMAELLRATADTLAAKEAAAWLAVSPSTKKPSGRPRRLRSKITTDISSIV